MALSCEFEIIHSKQRFKRASKQCSIITCFKFSRMEGIDHSIKNIIGLIL